MQQPVTGPCAIDTRFQTLMQIDEADFFSLNSIATASLPDYTVSSQYFYRNYYRNFLYWKYENRDKMRELVQKEDIVTSMQSA